MIYPPIRDLTEKTDSRYSLVIATAKRAREISEDETKDVKKPIIEAIREINSGEVIIVSSEEPKNTEEKKEIDLQEEFISDEE